MIGNSLVPAEQISQCLADLITRADKFEPHLAVRLREYIKWIKKLSPGEIKNRKYVYTLLNDLCNDSELWLDLKEAKEEEGIDFYNEVLISFNLNPSEEYWLTVLFPAWFRAHLKSMS